MKLPIHSALEAFEGYDVFDILHNLRKTLRYNYPEGKYLTVYNSVAVHEKGNAFVVLVAYSIYHR